MLTRILAVLVLGFTTAPSAAASTLSWTHPTKIPRSGTLTGVTCQSPSLCVAYGYAGRLFVSSHPSGGAATWKVRHIDGSVSLKSVSCSSASLCAAYDASGNVLVSTHPLRGASTWRRSAVNQQLDSLTCPSSSLCVGVDSAGNVVTSTSPARPSSWRTVSAGDRSPTYECIHYQQPSDCAEMSLTDGSCPSAHLCVALDQAGNVVLSTDPAADPSAWTVAYAAPLDFASGLTAVGCTSARFCFGTDSWGNFLSSVNPAAGQSPWTATGLGGVENGPDATLGQIITEAACSSSSACIATGLRGRLFAGADPATPVPDWRSSRLFGISITCAGHGWCFAVDSTLHVHATNDAAHPHSWSRAFGDQALSDATARFSCPSAKLCVAVDGVGRVATGTRAQRRR